MSTTGIHPTPARPRGPLRLPVRPHGHLCPLPALDPLQGGRTVDVRDRRTAVDCAQVWKDLAEVHFPEAAKIVLV